MWPDKKKGRKEGDDGGGRRRPETRRREEEAAAHGVSRSRWNRSTRVLREIAAAGGGCVIVDSLFNGLEVLKVQAQMSGAPSQSRSILTLGRSMVANGGIGAVCLPGLGATWLRGMTYTGFRIGAYPETKRRLQSATGANGFVLGAAAGLLTGSIGAALFTPIDVVRVRMQANPRVYAHISPPTRTLRAFSMVVASGGWQALYSGWSACVLRAALLSSSQLASYDLAKSVWRNLSEGKEGPLMHTACSFASGVIAQAVVQPADTLRTVMLSGTMSSSTGLTGCAASIVRNGGIGALYRGFLPAVMRQGPVIAVQMPLIEEIRRIMGLGYM